MTHHCIQISTRPEIYGSHSSTFVPHSTHTKNHGSLVNHKPVGMRKQPNLNAFFVYFQFALYNKWCIQEIETQLLYKRRDKRKRAAIGQLVLKLTKEEASKIYKVVNWRSQAPQFKLHRCSLTKAAWCWASLFYIYPIQHTFLTRRYALLPFF